jgi:hypothetical protein
MAKPRKKEIMPLFRGKEAAKNFLTTSLPRRGRFSRNSLLRMNPQECTPHLPHPASQTGASPAADEEAALIRILFGGPSRELTLSSRERSVLGSPVTALNILRNKGAEYSLLFWGEKDRKDFFFSTFLAPKYNWGSREESPSCQVVFKDNSITLSSLVLIY